MNKGIIPIHENSGVVSKEVGVLRYKHCQQNNLHQWKEDVGPEGSLVGRHATHNRVSISLRLFPARNGPFAGSCHVPRYLLFAMVQSTLSKKVLESRCVSISKTKTPFRNTFLIFFVICNRSFIRYSEAFS